jgi:hypothetical protein
MTNHYYIYHSKLVPHNVLSRTKVVCEKLNYTLHILLFKQFLKFSDDDDDV